MIEEVNRVRKAKIITIEDPIEFVFTHDKSIITQREIGTDTEGFPDALHAALRQDPDVIMVGEMRDLMTVDTSLKAAETGHMVFSSIHTSDVASTISRLVSFFPPEEHPQVRVRLAENLKAIVSLRLLPNKKQTARVPAVEVMRSTRSIQECIKDANKTHEITDFIAKGRPENMQTFDQHLLDLLRANKISVETALAAASNPTDFRTKLALEGGDPDASVTTEKVLGPMELESDERF
jgi:twitching motility protein PilT